jgi:hypothetical protein
MFSFTAYNHEKNGGLISTCPVAGAAAAVVLLPGAAPRGLQNFEMNGPLYNLVFAEQYPSDIGKIGGK